MSIYYKYVCDYLQITLVRENLYRVTRIAEFISGAGSRHCSGGGHIFMYNNIHDYRYPLSALKLFEIDHFTIVPIHYNIYDINSKFQMHNPTLTN